MSRLEVKLQQLEGKSSFAYTYAYLFTVCLLPLGQDFYLNF